MVLGLRHVAYPHTPKEVRACLDAAEAGAVVVERGGEPMIIIMPVGEFERLSALADGTGAPGSTSEEAAGASARDGNVR